MPSDLVIRPLHAATIGASKLFGALRAATITVVLNIRVRTYRFPSMWDAHKSPAQLRVGRTGERGTKRRHFRDEQTDERTSF